MAPSVTGLWFALASAAAFGFSGPFAKALMEAGWSPGATVLVRVAGAALVLAPPALRTLAGRPRLSWPAVRTLLLFGLIAVAGVQLAFFNAVSRLEVGVALLLEYLGLVMVVGWVWLRTRVRPSAPVVGGVVLALLGLVLVLDLTGSVTLDPVGVTWGLVAAVGLAGYFIISGGAGDELPPIVLVAGGLGIGALGLGAAGLAGAVPLEFAARDAVIGGLTTSFWVPLVAMVLVPTVLAYIFGAAGNRRLGARLASVTGLTEVLFAILVAWALLDELPRPVQLAGGVLIVAGVVLIRRNEKVQEPVVQVSRREPVASTAP